jgi:hypothetical protein
MISNIFYLNIIFSSDVLRSEHSLTGSWQSEDETISETMVTATLYRALLFTAYLKMDNTLVYLLDKQFLCQANDVTPSPFHSA